MPTRINTFLPDMPNNEGAQKAYWILIYSNQAASSFLKNFDATRRARHARGAASDDEQDLLRAMLIFAASGLDSAIKQLVTDALSVVVSKQSDAKKVFTNEVTKKIYRNKNLEVNLLVQALIHENPHAFFVEKIVKEITNNSLQSVDALARVGSYFAIETKKFISDFEKLRDIFKVRNEIAHEMDIDFTQPNRNRHSRRTNDMILYTNEIFKVGKLFLENVDSKL